jgi:hypothetical protein
MSRGLGDVYKRQHLLIGFKQRRGIGSDLVIRRRLIKIRDISHKASTALTRCHRPLVHVCRMGIWADKIRYAAGREGHW